MPDPNETQLVTDMAAVFFNFHRLRWKNSHGNPLLHREMLLFHCIADGDDGPAGPTVSELSRRLGVKPPTVTHMLNFLEHRGLIERRMDPGDRRAVRVLLTAEGRQLADRNVSHLFGWMQQLVHYLGPQDARQLIALMNKTYQFFRSRAEHPDGPDGSDERSGRFWERKYRNPC